MNNCIAVVGDNCVDRISVVGDDSPPAILVGGNAVNVAIQLASAGQPVKYFGSVGDDPNGAKIIQALNEHDVSTEYCHVVRGTTSVTDIQVDLTGNRHMVAEDFGVCETYRVPETELPIIKQCSHVHIGWLNDDNQLKDWLVQEGIPISRDISINADPVQLDVNGVSLAFASQEGARSVALERATELLSQGAARAIITRGADGSLCSDGNEVVEVDAMATSVVDTTGAGDSFIAGFIKSYVAGQSIEECLKMGRKLAATTCSHQGGFLQR